jgi:hypothetical protein
VIVFFFYERFVFFYFKFKMCLIILFFTVKKRKKMVIERVQFRIATENIENMQRKTKEKKTRKSVLFFKFFFV